MKSYTQLTQEQRYQISALLKGNHTQSEIARILEVHKSTISRELRRNRGQRGYRPKQAQRFAMGRRNKAKPRISAFTWMLVETMIKDDLCPEQVSGRLRLTCGIHISHEWIYQYLLKDKHAGGNLHEHLRCQKKRKKRYGSCDRRGTLKNRVSIEQRPAIVEKRERLGDWEVDTIIGKGHKQAIVSLVDRVSRMTLLKKVDRRTAPAVADAAIDLLKSVRVRSLTITADNGKEFAEHERIAKETHAAVYFAHPYASWERGTNENTNGLVRQYFPKKSSFVHLTDHDMAFVMDRLNNRPRKCLGFLTPIEVFLMKSNSVALGS